MKVFLVAMFSIVLVFSTVTGLSAEENNSTLIPGSLFLYNMSVDPDLSSSSGENEWVFRDIGAFWRLSAGFLNMGLGFGSLLMGDWNGFFGIFGRQVLGLGFGALGVVTVYGTFQVTSNMNPLLLLIGGFIVPVLGIAIGGSLVLFGVPYYFSGLIYGFRRPFVYQKPVAATARVDDLRNWTVALLPGDSSKVNGQIAFTAHF